MKEERKVCESVGLCVRNRFHLTELCGVCFLARIFSRKCGESRVSDFRQTEPKFHFLIPSFLTPSDNDDRGKMSSKNKLTKVSTSSIPYVLAPYDRF